MRNPWALTAWIVLLSATILSLAQWPAYPYFLDSAYHLAVIRGFQEAGGPVLHSFWMAAPEGQPFLYPPLFHLILLPLSLLGCPPMTLARLWSFVCFPALLLAAWLVLSRIFTARLACLTLIALAAPFSFFLAAVNYPPATLVLILLFGIMLALARGKWPIGGLLLGLAFWTHASFPWLIALSLILFGWIEPSFRKSAWKIAALGILAGLPWTFHMLRHLPELQFHVRGEERFLETSPFWLILGLIGLKIAWSRRGLHRFPAALAIGFLPMLIGWKFRYFSSQGLFTWLLLSGVALDELVHPAGRIRPRWALGPLLAGLLLGSPGMHWSPVNHALAARGLHWAWADTTLATLAGRPQRIPRATAQSIFREKFMGELVDLVKKQTQPEELIHCNYDYMGLMLYARTGRALTNQRRAEPISPARLVVWIKQPGGGPDPELKEILSRHTLIPVGETEIALLYRNPNADGKKRMGPPRGVLKGGNR